jgi:hypothetical protein
MSLPALAPSQKGWLIGVISGMGFLIALFSSAMIDSHLSSVVEIRNPKQEIRNKFKIRNSKIPRLKAETSLFRHWKFFSFEIVSCFGFRNLDFELGLFFDQASLPRMAAAVQPKFLP